MADVTTYKRSTMAYAATANTVVHVGDVRASTDPIVTSNPQWWVALADADLTDNKNKSHQW